MFPLVLFALLIMVLGAPGFNMVFIGLEDMDPGDIAQLGFKDTCGVWLIYTGRSKKKKQFQALIGNSCATISCIDEVKQFHPIAYPNIQG